MEISSSYGMSGLLGLDALNGVNADGTSRKRSRSSSASGDTVDISEEAKKLFSEKIHQYDTQQTATTAKAAQNGSRVASGYDDPAAEQAADTAGGGSGGGSSSSGSSVEEIKKKIESLTSQLMSMASQIGGGSGDAGAMSKMNALQSQIAALEAQLNEAKQAG